MNPTAAQLDLFPDAPPAPPPPLVYGGGPPAHTSGRRTERSAAGRMRSLAPTLRVTVLDWIRAAGRTGLTAKEAGARYAVGRGCHPDDGSCRYSIAPRITELSQGGYVRDSGNTRGGAIVWTATDKHGDGRVCERDPVNA